MAEDVEIKEKQTTNPYPEPIFAFPDASPLCQNSSFFPLTMHNARWIQEQEIWVTARI